MVPATILADAAPGATLAARTTRLVLDHLRRDLSARADDSIHGQCRPDASRDAPGARPLDEILHLAEGWQLLQLKCVFNRGLGARTGLHQTGVWDGAAVYGLGLASADVRRADAPHAHAVLR